MRIIVSFLIFFPCFVYAETAAYGSFSYFTEGEGNRGGAELSLHTFVDDRYGFKSSAMLYYNGNQREDTGLFIGYSGLGYVALDLPIQPYLGMGIFLGQLQQNDEDCDEYSEDEYCNDIYLTGYYPEVGLIWKNKKVLLSIFTRRYFDSENAYDAFNTYGFSIGWAVDT